jgi:hypothetical protein
MITQLPHSVVALLLECAGLIRAGDMATIGIGRRGLATLITRGLLIAVADGVYTAATLPARLGPWSWFALRSRAFAMASPPDAVAAGWSAVALHDLPTLGQPPSLPSVIRRASPPRGSDRSPRGRTRFASLDPGWITSVAGTAVVHPAVTTIDIGRRSGRLATLIAADAVARLPGGRESMRTALDAMRHWPGSGRARWAVAHADGDCESPLETVGRYAVLRSGLSLPLSNVWVGVDGPRYRLDHYWVEQRVALEGDGIQKYRMARAGQLSTEDQALLVEKDREFELRCWGVMSERYTWRRALFEPRSVAHRCASALQGPRLPAHPGLRWWPAEEGYRLLGMAMPRTQLGVGPGWRRRVDAALRELFADRASAPS